MGCTGRCAPHPVNPPRSWSPHRSSLFRLPSPLTRHPIIPIPTQDELNHASLIDGMRGARKHVYRHNDMEDLGRLLASDASSLRCVVTDRLFSMDGDFCDLAGLLRLQRRHGFLLVVDEAHSTLVVCDDDEGLGKMGLAWPNRDVIRVGTLSKAVGQTGTLLLKVGGVTSGEVSE